MNVHADQAQENTVQSYEGEGPLMQRTADTVSQFSATPPDGNSRNNIQEAANNSTQVQQLKVLQESANNRQPVQQLTADSSSAAGFSADAPIQRYAASNDGNYNVSENNLFAVPRNEQYPKSMLTSDGQAPLAFDGGLAWNQGGGVQIDGVDYVRYQADITAYEEENGVAADKHCGTFARELSGVQQNDEQSTSAAGGVLYDSHTTPDVVDSGWDNHYASVVKVDSGDHSTYETAVGIQDTWIGIYGTERGHTFKFKTQMANIERLIAMEDIVIPARLGIERSFWDWLCCRPGRQVVRQAEARIPMGISEEDGNLYQQEMVAWRDNGTEPESAYMQVIVQKLIQEAAMLEEDA